MNSFLASPNHGDGTKMIAIASRCFNGKLRISLPDEKRGIHASSLASLLASDHRGNCCGAKVSNDIGDCSGNIIFENHRSYAAVCPRIDVIISLSKAGIYWRKTKKKSHARKSKGVSKHVMPPDDCTLMIVLFEVTERA